jgi:hypothetical protein
MVVLIALTTSEEGAYILDMFIGSHKRMGWACREGKIDLLAMMLCLYHFSVANPKAECRTVGEMEALKDLRFHLHTIKMEALDNHHHRPGNKHLKGQWTAFH